MNSSMTIGQYFPGNSPVHRMDARMKIVLTFLMVVAVFLCKNFWSLGLAIVFMILAVGLSKIPPKTILKSIKPLIVIILITGVINLFYGDGEPLVTLGKLKITMDGVMTAVFYGCAHYRVGDCRQSADLHHFAYGIDGRA